MSSPRPVPPPRSGVSLHGSSPSINVNRRPIPPPRPDRPPGRLERSHSATDKPSDFHFDAGGTAAQSDQRPTPPPRPPRLAVQDGRRATVADFFGNERQSVTPTSPSSLRDFSAKAYEGETTAAANSPQQPSLSSLDAYLNRKVEKRLISRNSILDLNYVYDASKFNSKPSGVFSAPTSPPESPPLSPPHSPRERPTTTAKTSAPPTSPLPPTPQPLTSPTAQSPNSNNNTSTTGPKFLSQSTPAAARPVRKYDYQQYQEESSFSEDDVPKEVASPKPRRPFRDEIPRPLSLMKMERQQSAASSFSSPAVYSMYVESTSENYTPVRRGTKPEPVEISLESLCVSPRTRKLTRTLSKQLQKRKTTIALPLYADKSKEELDLTDRKLDRLAAVELAVALREFTKIKTLRVFSNGIGNEGAGGFADLLFYNTSLATLKLKYKELERKIGSLSSAPEEECFGDEGAEYIAEALETNQTLARLDLSNNCIDTSGLRALSSALTINKGLRYLDISGNNFNTEADATILAKALRNNHSLTMLKLKNSLFDLDALAALLKCLKRNRSLLEIDLTCKKHSIPKLTPRHIDLVFSYLEKNRTLTALRWRDKNQLHIPEPIQKALHQNVWFLKERGGWKKDRSPLESDQELELIMKRHGAQFICSDINLSDISIVQLLNWKNIQELYLANNDITTVPSEIMLLKFLKHLVLAGNKISALPASLGELVALRSLDVSHNQLVDIPSTLQSLRNIRRLFFCHNQLQSIPGGIVKLSALQHLDLSFNKITVLPSDFGKIKHLENLWLQNNNLTFLPKSISDLSELRSLKVQNNNLRELPPDISELKRLEVLNVRDNPLPKDIAEGNLQAIFSVLKSDRKVSF